jgi:hypothetical protein
MKMPLAQYVTDIAAAYLMLPVITTGIGIARRHQGRVTNG